MGTSDGEELRTVLSKRRSVLEAISTNGKTKPELVGELEHSRSTIDRAIDQLDKTGCINTDGGKYRVSPVGKVALQTYQAFSDTSDGVAAAAPVLNALGPDDPIDRDMFREAEVYVSNPKTPEVGIQRSIELKQKTHTFRGYAPVVFEDYFDSQIEQLQKDEFSSELIIERDLFNQIQTHFKEEYDRLVSYDGVSIYVTERKISYAPWLMTLDQDIYAGMTVYDEGAIRGLIINNSAEAVSWMEELLTSLLTSASKEV